jgi:hypothetical protein
MNLFQNRVAGIVLERSSGVENVGMGGANGGEPACLLIVT